jgi:glycosyltransferase involved in cell wall biosynthesis
MTRVNLHLFFSPIRNETRLLKEAKALRDLGVFGKVVVVGYWESDLPRTECIGGFLDVIRAQTAIHLMRARGGAAMSQWMRKLLAVRSFFDYSGVAVREARIRKPTHVSCHNLLLLPVAWLAALISGARLVYVPHELEVERTGLVGFLKNVSALVERLFIGSCHRVVVVCDPIADWYRKRYRLLNVHVVRSIPEFGRSIETAESRFSRRLASGLSAAGRVFIYQGVLDRMRGIDDLLNLFEIRYGRGDHLVLMGYGEAVSRIEAVSARSPNIHFKPAVPIREIIDHSALADVGVFCLNDPLTLSYQYSLPNKFFEYLVAGLPVIVSPNLLLLSQIVEENRLGWVVPVSGLPALLDSLTDAEILQKQIFVEKYVASNTWEVERLIYRTVYT